MAIGKRPFGCVRRTGRSGRVSSCASQSDLVPLALPLRETRRRWSDRQLGCLASPLCRSCLGVTQHSEGMRRCVARILSNVGRAPARSDSRVGYEDVDLVGLQRREVSQGDPTAAGNLDVARHVVGLAVVESLVDGDVSPS